VVSILYLMMASRQIFWANDKLTALYEVKEFFQRGWHFKEWSSKGSLTLRNSRTYVVSMHVQLCVIRYSQKLEDVCLSRLAVFGEFTSSPIGSPGPTAPGACRCRYGGQARSICNRCLFLQWRQSTTPQ
jgi:hypothetical protein